MDLTNTYHWMRIEEDDEWTTAFRTHYSHFKYQMILFGLCNASVGFQDYINKIPVKKLDLFIIVYLNGLLIFPEDES